MIHTLLLQVIVALPVFPSHLTNLIQKLNKKLFSSYTKHLMHSQIAIFTYYQEEICFQRTLNSLEHIHRSSTGAEPITSCSSINTSLYFSVFAFAQRQTFLLTWYSWIRKCISLHPVFCANSHEQQTEAVSKPQDVY